MQIAARRTGLLALAALLTVLSSLRGTQSENNDQLPQPGHLPKPRIPPLGLGFDVYCRVCRHVMEVASREVWNFRGDNNAVAARLQDVCTTASDFSIPDKNVLARQVCPILHNGKIMEIAKVLNGLEERDDEEMQPHTAATVICNQVHEAGRPAKSRRRLNQSSARLKQHLNTILLLLISLHTACDRHGRAVSVLGDLEKLKRDYKNVQSTHQQSSAAPSPPPATSRPPKGPPKVDVGTTKKLLKKRTKKSEL